MAVQDAALALGTLGHVRLSHRPAPPRSYGFDLPNTIIQDYRGSHVPSDRLIDASGRGATDRAAWSRLLPASGRKPVRHLIHPLTPSQPCMKPTASRLIPSASRICGTHAACFPKSPLTVWLPRSVPAPPLQTSLPLPSVGQASAPALPSLRIIILNSFHAGKTTPGNVHQSPTHAVLSWCDCHSKRLSAMQYSRGSAFSRLPCGCLLAHLSCLTTLFMLIRPLVISLPRHATVQKPFLGQLRSQAVLLDTFSLVSQILFSPCCIGKMTQVGMAGLHFCKLLSYPAVEFDLAASYI